MLKARLRTLSLYYLILGAAPAHADWKAEWDTVLAGAAKEGSSTVLESRQPFLLPDLQESK